MWIMMGWDLYSNIELIYISISLLDQLYALLISLQNLWRAFLANVAAHNLVWEIEYRLNFRFRFRVALVFISWFYIPDLILNFLGIKWKLSSYGLGRKPKEAIAGVGEGPHEVGASPALTDVNFLTWWGQAHIWMTQNLNGGTPWSWKDRNQGMLHGIRTPSGVSIWRRSSRGTTLAFLLLHSLPREEEAVIRSVTWRKNGNWVSSSVFLGSVRWQNVLTRSS